MSHRPSVVLAGLFGAASLVAAAALSPRFLPYNMDEFVHYHALGCATAPLQKDLPSYRDGCGLFDLRLPLTRTWLPLRSYYYIGSLPALLFAPLKLVLDDPVAARVQGATIFLLFVCLAACLLRVPPSRVVLAGLVFPVFPLAFIADTGPVGLSTLLLLAVLLAVRRSLREESRTNAVTWAVVAGSAAFIGVWIKPVFGWWLPAVALFGLAEARQLGVPWRNLGRRLWPPFAVGVLALVVPTAVLLASVDVDGRQYAAAVTRARLTLDPIAAFERAGGLLRFLADASLLAPRNVTLPSAPLDVAPAVVSGLLLAASLFWWKSRRAQLGGWALLAVATLGLSSTSAFTQWPHHLVSSAVFLVLALALALDAARWPTRLAVAVLLVAVWTSVGLRWPNAVFPRQASPSKDDLLAFVRREGLDRDTLQVHSSWGTYYIGQLFGDPMRMVVSIRGISDDPVQLREVSCLARERGRSLLLISARRWPRLQTADVDRILGRPAEVRRFGDWRAVTYRTTAVEGCGAVDGIPSASS